MELLEEWWKCSLAEDHYKYLCSRELQLPVYHAQSPQLSLRRPLVDWLAIICDTYDLCSTARHLMVALLDYFMDKFVIADHQIKLAGLAALLVACKYEEVELRIPKMVELNKHVHPSPSYSKREIMEMELILLQFYEWNVGLPTAAHFVDYFLVDGLTKLDFRSNWTSVDAEQSKTYIAKYANYFLEISLQDFFYRNCWPSLVCASAIAAARMCLKMQIPWPQELQKRTNYRWTDLAPLVDRMLITYKKDSQTSNQNSQAASPSCNHSTGSSLAGTPNISIPAGLSSSASYPSICTMHM